MRKLTEFFTRKLSSVKSGFAFISKAKKSFYKEGKENNLSGLDVTQCLGFVSFKPLKLLG